MSQIVEKEAIDVYSPDRLLNTVREALQLKNDAALARKLEVPAPPISKIRSRRLTVGAGILIRIHEVTGLEIFDLRSLMGDRRSKLRIGKVRGRPVVADTKAAVSSPQH